jgi:arylsulfatase A-like enzyme
MKGLSTDKAKGFLMFGLALLAALSACSCGPAQDTSSTLPPNILFIMSDDHSSQAWGLYGSHLDAVAPTPHIRRLAREGCLLLNCFCTNSICVPSRASILTGQYSHRSGLYTLSEALDPAAENVAKQLQEAGYQTAVIGKWHLKSQPSGFDHYNVLPGQGRYHDPVLRSADNWNEGTEHSGFSTDVITDLSLEWLENRDKAKPFFLMCHFKATHEPFAYAARFADLFEAEDLPEPESLYEFGPDLSGRTFSGQVLEILGQRYVENPSKRYPGESFDLEGLDARAARGKIYQKFIKDYLRGVAGIDENIGRLLSYLDQAGLTRDTVLIYTSDQGYFLGEHGFFDKRIMYEESLRMPFVIRYPREIDPGSRLDDIILNTDFAPLFLDYAGLQVPDRIQGTSFRANLQGKTPITWRKSMYYRYWLHQVQRPAHFGIRSERYKLIFFYGAPLGMKGAHTEATPPGWEFYDLAADPTEAHNAYHDPQYGDVIQELKERLKKIRMELDDIDEQFPQMREILADNWED